MTPEDRAANLAALRLRILTLLRPYTEGMSQSTIHTLLRAIGFGRLTIEELDQELSYMCDRGWIVRAPRPLMPQLTFYRLTASGTDQLPDYAL